MMRVRVVELPLEASCEQWEEALRQAASIISLVPCRGNTVRAVFTAFDEEAAEQEFNEAMSSVLGRLDSARSFPLAEEQAASLPSESDSGEQAADGQQPS